MEIENRIFDCETFVATFGKESEQVACMLNNNGYGKAVLSTKEKRLEYNYKYGGCPELFIIADFSTEFNELKKYIANLPYCMALVFIISENKNMPVDYIKFKELGVMTLFLPEKPIEQQIQFCYEFIVFYLTRETRNYLFDFFGGTNKDGLCTLDYKKIAKLDFILDLQKTDWNNFSDKGRAEGYIIQVDGDITLGELDGIQKSADKQSILGTYMMSIGSAKEHKPFMCWWEVINEDKF